MIFKGRKNIVAFLLFQNWDIHAQILNIKLLHNLLHYLKSPSAFKIFIIQICTCQTAIAVDIRVCTVIYFR